MRLIFHKARVCQISYLFVKIGEHGVLMLGLGTNKAENPFYIGFNFDCLK